MVVVEVVVPFDALVLVVEAVSERVIHRWIRCECWPQIRAICCLMHVPSQCLFLKWQVVSGRSWILAGTVSVSVLLDVVCPLPRLAASWTQRGHSECQSVGVAAAHVMWLTSAAV